MTKMKSKKMTKSTFAIIIMGIVMVAMLAFGGTFAYFTAKANDVSASAKTAKIMLSTEATTVTFENNNLLPTETTSAEVDYVDGSSRGTYVFFNLKTAWATALVGSDVEIVISKVTVNGTELTTKTTEGVYYYTNGTKDAAPAETNLKVVVTISMTGKAESVNGVDDSKAMDNTFTVSFTASSIQQYGFASAQEAYAALIA